MLSFILVSLLAIGAVYCAPEKGCGNNPADIVFVLDESGSIWGPHFTQQLEFVQAVIASFDVGFNKTHVGVLTFGTNYRIIFPLGQYTSEAELKSAVKAIKQKRGETYTHLALKSMREEMFSSKYSRPWVRHVAIIITDGESNYPKDTEREADLGHKAGIQMFAIGVGQAVAKKELEAIASSSDLVFMVNSYDALESLRLILAWKACEPPTTPAPPTTTTTTPPPPQMIEGCDGHKTMDHVWAISDQANAEETNYALNFIKETTRDMNISPENIQVGLAPRFCEQGSQIRLKDHDTKAGFWENLDRLRLTSVRTDLTIEYIRQQGMSSSYGARSGAVKYGILIVDNRAADWEKTLREAELAKQAGVRLIVIGVGDHIDQGQLRSLASSSSDYFYAQSYRVLVDLKSQLIQRVCEGIRETRVSSRNLEIFERFFGDY